MDGKTTEEFLTQFEQLDCPFTRDVDATYLTQLLLTPSPHRMRLLSWLFSRVDTGVHQKIESFHQRQDPIISPLEIDPEVQLLTDVGAALGVCSPTDFSLIRGKASEDKHVALWKNLLTIVTMVSGDTISDSFAAQFQAVDQTMEYMLRSCDIASALSTAIHVLPPAIKAEIDISLKAAKFSASSSSSSLARTNELGDKLEILQSELDKYHQMLADCKLANPDLQPNTDDASALDKIYRSLGVTLNDLNQLQTTFLQTFENHFQPYCDKSASRFTNLGTMIYNIDGQFASLLTLFDNLKTLKLARQQLSAQLEV